MKDEEEIRIALRTIINNTTYKVPAAEEIKLTLEFSDDFKRKKVWQYDKKFIYLRRRGYRRIAVILVILISLAATGITAYAFYKLFYQRVNERNTDVQVRSLETGKNTIEQIYELRGVPAEYVVVDLQENEDSVFTVYSDGKDLLYFYQMLIGSENSVDNEETIQQEVSVNGMDAIYYVRHNQATIIFYHAGYVFKIAANDALSKDDLILMAESIQVKEGAEENEK